MSLAGNEIASTYLTGSQCTVDIAILSVIGTL